MALTDFLHVIGQLAARRLIDAWQVGDRHHISKEEMTAILQGRLRPSPAVLRAFAHELGGDEEYFRELLDRE